MSKRIFFASILSLAVMFFIGGVMLSRDFSVQGANPRVHKKDLSERGVRVVISSDSGYDSDLNALLRERNSAFRSVANTFRPFSAFVRNTTHKDILAYKLTWEIKMPDGSVVEYPRSYFAPEYLMGVPPSAQYDDAIGSIKKSSARFFTLIPTPSETEGGSRGVMATRVRDEEVEAFRESGRVNGITPFVNKITEQLSNATDVTVSLESVLFDDGEFVGPAGDEEFVKLKASVAAKHDLLTEIKRVRRANQISTDEIFTRVALIANQNIQIPTPGSGFGPYYNYFRKLQAQEVLSSRQALGDDAKTLRIFLQRLDRKWIIPFEAPRR